MVTNSDCGVSVNSASSGGAPTQTQMATHAQRGETYRGNAIDPGGLKGVIDADIIGQLAHLLKKVTGGGIQGRAWLPSEPPIPVFRQADRRR